MSLKRSVDKLVIVDAMRELRSGSGWFGGRRAMSVETFCFLLHEAKFRKNDKKWFPKWVRR